MKLKGFIKLFLFPVRVFLLSVWYYLSIGELSFKKATEKALLKIVSKALVKARQKRNEKSKV